MHDVADVLIVGPSQVHGPAVGDCVTGLGRYAGEHRMSATRMLAEVRKAAGGSGGQHCRGNTHVLSCICRRAADDCGRVSTMGGKQRGHAMQAQQPHTHTHTHLKHTYIQGKAIPGGLALLVIGLARTD